MVHCGTALAAVVAAAGVAATAAVIMNVAGVRSPLGVVFAGDARVEAGVVIVIAVVAVFV